MKHTSLSPRAFLARFLAVALALLVVGALFIIAVDPYEHYRKSRTDYVLNERYMTPGMIDHYDYDAVLIGSSMCQNFDMDDLDDKTSHEVLKVVKGGMTIDETSELCRRVNEAGKAEVVYLGIDLSRFNTPEPEDEYYPTHLKNDTLLDDYNYFYSYEVWSRYLPLDLALLAADKAGVSLPAVITDKTDKDDIGRWAERAEAAGDFAGKEQLLKNYLENRGTVGAQNTEGMYERMCARLDAWLAEGPFAEDVTYHVFFSPYSSLYWTHTKREGSFDAFLAFRTYFFSKLSSYDNVVAHDFQAMEVIRNLDLYKDISHYHASVNYLMAEALADKTYLATAERVEENNAFLQESVSLLQEEYPALNTPLKKQP